MIVSSLLITTINLLETEFLVSYLGEASVPLTGQPSHLRGEVKMACIRWGRGAAMKLTSSFTASHLLSASCNSARSFRH